MVCLLLVRFERSIVIGTLSCLWQCWTVRGASLTLGISMSIRWLLLTVWWTVVRQILAPLSLAMLLRMKGRK